MKNIVKVNTQIGTKIIYSDACNYMLYEVTENFGDGITLKALNGSCNVEKGKHEDLYFSEMQEGWKILSD